MAVFNDACITDAGREMMERLISEAGKMQFTGIAVGTGTYTKAEKEESSIREMTALKKLLKVYDINSVSKKEGLVILKSIIENTGFTSSQSITEIGLIANDGREACRKFKEGNFELVLLDLMIPYISGMDVLQFIRKESVVPVIILSAKDTDSDKTLGLGLGADDYISKPFSVTEVLARIKANIRRATQYGAAAVKEKEVLTAGDIVMDLSDYTVKKAGQNIDLTAKEFEILKLLMKSPKKVYTKEQIYSLVWNEAYFGDENAVNVHISRLRNKIEDDSRSPRYVVTVWGIGYKLGEMP